MSLRIRRGTDAERQTVTFLEGELVYTTDTKKVFIGDGATLGGVSVDSTTGSINNLTDVNTAGVQIGQILQWNGSSFVPGEQGEGRSIFGQDSTLLVDATNSSINLDGTVKGHVVPDQNIAYDLGSASNRFRDLYLSGTSINLGGSTITSSGGKVSFSEPVVAQFEQSGNTDLKDNYITNTAVGGAISLRPAVNSNMNVATTGGTVVFKVDLAANSFGANDDAVLQLPVFEAADFTAHSPLAGQVVFDNSTKGLKVYNGTGWASAGGAGGGGIVEGNAYRINIVDAGSTVVVNTDTGVVTANLTGDVTGNVTGNITSAGASNFDNITINGGVIDGTSIGASVQSTVRGTTITADTEFVGDLTGDVTGNVTGNLIGNVTGNLNGNITATGELIGNVIGDLEGNARGNFIGFDSTVIINGDTNKVVGDIETSKELIVTKQTAESAPFLRGRLYGGTLSSPTEPADFERNGIMFMSHNGTNFTDASLINSYHRSGGGSNIALSPTDAGGTFFNTALELDGIAQTIIMTGGVVGNIQTISGPGAVNTTSLVTEITTTGADAFTLANGSSGQVKMIVMTVDGGDATLTPTTFANGTTITFNDVGDSVTLVYGALGWMVMSNQGATVA